MKARVLCGGVIAWLVVGGWLDRDVQAQTETQRFDSEARTSAAGWMANDEGRRSRRGCRFCETDLGWKDTNLAGGAGAGEAGGVLHRSGGLPIGFYGDTTIGELTLDMPIAARGRVVLVNYDFDGHLHFGFFDGRRLLADPSDYGAELGFLLAEPGGGVAPNFRWGYTLRTDDGLEQREIAGFRNGVPDGKPVEFALRYVPDTGIGGGVLTLALGTEPEIAVALTPGLQDGGAHFTAFGIWTGPFLEGEDSSSAVILLDDVTYTSLPPSVPAPRRLANRPRDDVPVAGARRRATSVERPGSAAR